MTLWTSLFGTGPDLTWGQECARAVAVCVYGLVAIRIAGRRVFGKWSALDTVVSIIVGSTLSRALTGGAPLGGTLVAISIVLALHRLLAHGTARWAGMSDLLEGAALPLAQKGRLHREALRRNAISARDLDEALRQHGLAALPEGASVVLEPSGRISVLRAG